jgi:hypothetical protein
MLMRGLSRHARRALVRAGTSRYGPESYIFARAMIRRMAAARGLADLW